MVVSKFLRPCFCIHTEEEQFLSDILDEVLMDHAQVPSVDDCYEVSYRYNTEIIKNLRFVKDFPFFSTVISSLDFSNTIFNIIPF